LILLNLQKQWISFFKKKRSLPRVFSFDFAKCSFSWVQKDQRYKAYSIRLSVGSIPKSKGSIAG